MLEEKTCVVTLVHCAKAALPAKDGSFRPFRSPAAGGGEQAHRCRWRLHLVQEEQCKHVQVKVVFLAPSLSGVVAMGVVSLGVVSLGVVQEPSAQYESSFDTCTQKEAAQRQGKYCMHNYQSRIRV